ncbi:hypothetical protein DPMN_192524 [Dreissena polymorpha]|uniref:Uncharacterized protein n=1 Tax=Dreissena polymorpha TaxID=45954 RepID=A0A9D4BGW7_DREPO|nr:hypothetical protein DPMN_192524 [Dreissena polymorpha]
MTILLFQNRSPTKRTKPASPDHQNQETGQPKAEPVSNAYEVFNIAVRRYLNMPSTSSTRTTLMSCTLRYQSRRSRKDPSHNPGRHHGSVLQTQE